MHRPGLLSRLDENSIDWRLPGYAGPLSRPRGYSPAAPSSGPTAVSNCITATATYASSENLAWADNRAHSIFGGTTEIQKKSSPVASACSLTRTSTKPVLPVSDTMLGEKLELALFRKSMSGSAGPCSLELLSWGYRAVKAGSTGIEVGGRQNAE